MTRKVETGRDPSASELREAKRVAELHAAQQKTHPAAVVADPSKLSHINTYGELPEFYIDKPFSCRNCGKEEIWKAESQKWYYEEAKGHIDATAVECHECRKAKKAVSGAEGGDA
ncbi:MAG: zinc-ribbon domain containing protein [Pseudomonadota bacterium]